MRSEIDVKSFLIGGFLVLSLMYSFGSVPWSRRDDPTRFAMVTNAGHTCVFDTATGHFWYVTTVQEAIQPPFRSATGPYMPTYAARDPNSLIEEDRVSLWRVATSPAGHAEAAR